MSKLGNASEKVKGLVKEVVGKGRDDEDLEREGRAQQEKVERSERAEELEERAEAEEQKAAGYKGEQKSRSRKR